MRPPLWTLVTHATYTTCVAALVLALALPVSTVALDSHYAQQPLGTKFDPQQQQTINVPVCPGPGLPLTTTTGTLTDRNDGTGTYANSVNCSALITAPAGMVVRVTFTAFNTEQCCDYLRLYEGDSASAPLRLQQTGTPVLPLVITTNQQHLFLRWTTDSSVVRTGWQLVWLFVTVVAIPCPGPVVALTDTIGVLVDRTDGTAQYANNQDCSAVITAPADQAPQITLTLFSTQSSLDLVRLYDGTTTSASLLATLSGTADLSRTITSSQPNIQLHIRARAGISLWVGFCCLLKKEHLQSPNLQGEGKHR